VVQLLAFGLISLVDLNELNTWLEKFVLNSTTELATMSKRLNTLVGPDPSTDGQPTAPGLPDLVADVHSMMTEQKRRNENEGMVGQRLDSLLQIMGQERERQVGQQSSELYRIEDVPATDKGSGRACTSYPGSTEG